MDIYSGHMNKLIEQLSSYQGLGQKGAQRLAFHHYKYAKRRS